MELLPFQLLRLASSSRVSPTQRVGGVEGIQGKKNLDPSQENHKAPKTKSSFGPDYQVELSGDEQKEVERLKERDREVRQHEQAHLAKAGSYAKGGPKYEFTSGPDGKRYATEGEVSIDTGKESTPEKTIQKAQVVQRAALGVQEPSSADRSVAAQAKAMEAEARKELTEENNSDSENHLQNRAINAFQKSQNAQAYQNYGQSLDLSA